MIDDSDHMMAVENERADAGRDSLDHNNQTRLLPNLLPGMTTLAQNKHTHQPMLERTRTLYR